MIDKSKSIASELKTRATKQLEDEVNEELSEETPSLELTKAILNENTKRDDAGRSPADN